MCSSRYKLGLRITEAINLMKNKDMVLKFQKFNGKNKMKTIKYCQLNKTNSSSENKK